MVLDDTIEYLEEMDKDRDAKTYNYELTLSQSLIELATKENMNLHNIPKIVIPDCDWNDSIPRGFKVEEHYIKTTIVIDDDEELISIYATL